MEIFQRFALTLAILMLGIWGVTLILIPDTISNLLSNQPVNDTLAGMMGAALLGLAFISFASITQRVSAQRALGVAVLLLVMESAYLMLGAGAMLVTAPTAMSIVAGFAVAFFLII